MNWKEQFERDLTELWQLYEKVKEAESLGVRYQIVEAVNAYNDKIKTIEDSISSLLEKLIDDIPPYGDSDFSNPNRIYFDSIVTVRQQLRDKWL
jgi:GTP1/Obg family GTP-binding protein